jgi:alanyl-tRNA synthetase
MGDLIREKLKSAVVVLGAVYDDRPNFLALVTPDLVTRGLHAGKIAQKVAAVTGGGGGGRPEMAQAGGKDKAKIDEALNLVKTLVRQK